MKKMPKPKNTKPKKFYKEIARCGSCKKMHVLDKTAANFSRYYCKDCYKKYSKKD